MRTWRRILTHPAFTSGLAALTLTVALYSGTLSLPLFSDDLVQIPWLETISWRELWTSPSPYRYYRPLWYSLWRMWGEVVGGLHPLGLHALNVAAHFVAAWLAGLLAATWIGPRDRRSRHVSAAIATAWFTLFPFARQAVAWPGAVYNPLVSGMAAGAALAYDCGRRSGNRRMLFLALLLAALAPLTYESGLLVGVMIGAVEGIGWLSHRRLRQRWWWALPFAGLLPITLLLWRTMRGSGVIGFGLSPTDLRRNLGYLVQGLTYPTAPLAQWLAERGSLDSELALWLVALPTLALLVWAGWQRDKNALWLGAVWAVLFALPPMISMEADWFALAPRFLYMTAGGGAVIWATALSGRLSERRALLSGVVLAALLISFVPASVFIRDGIQLYGMAGETIWQAAEAAHVARPLLLVNLPMRITPRERVYPLGFEGVTPLPMRVTAAGLVYVHTGIRDGAEGVAFGIVAADDPPEYTYQLFGRPVGWEELAAAVRAAHTVYLTQYEAGRIHLLEAGGRPTMTPGAPLARFGERVTLLDLSAACDETGQIDLIAHWQVETDVTTDATVFAHLLDSDGTLIAQADGYPLLEMFPFRLWKTGEMVRDVRHFDPLPAGTYTVRLGVWDLATGERWPDPDRADGVLLLPVTCRR